MTPNVWHSNMRSWSECPGAIQRIALLIMSGMSQFDSGVNSTLFRLAWTSPQRRGARMFNIVKHRDFMLAHGVPSWQVAERLRLEKYGHEYIVVIRANSEPVKEPKAPSD